MKPEPFLLDSGYGRKLDSDAVRQRYITKHAGSLPGLLFGFGFFVIFMYLPSIVLVIVSQIQQKPDLLWVASWVAAAVLPLAIGTVVGAIVSGKTRAAHLRFANEAQLVFGQLTSCQWVTTGSTNPNLSGSFQLEIRYEVTGPDGQTLTGGANVCRDDMLNAALPPPGTPVAILMRSEKSYIML